MSTPEENRPAFAGAQAESPPSTQAAPPGGAVLLSDEIQRRCQQQPKLIEPFVPDEAHLKPASYHLSIGDQVRIDGNDYTLTAEDPIREIPPHGIAMIRTLERLNMPNDLIARWNIKVQEVYNGLVWVGGPQVDPGYCGPLICPVFNLSTRPYKLEYGKPLFTIDFVKTTPFIPGASKPFEIKRRSESIGALDKLRTKSAIKEQLGKVEKAVDELRSETRAFQVGMMTAISILFAVLAVLFAFQFTGKIDWGTIQLQPVALSFVAIIIACFALVSAIVAWYKRW